MKDTRNNAFLKGTISLTLSVILTKILGVAFKVPLSYVLSDSGMGYFNTAYAIYGFFYILCTAGVPKSMTLVLSEYRAQNADETGDRDILRIGLSVFAKIGAFSTLLNIICAYACADLVGNKNAYLSIIAVAPSIFFVSLCGVLRGYLNSEERLSEIATSQLIEAGAKLLLGLLLSYIGVRIGASVHVISALAISGISIGSAVSYFYMLNKSKNTNMDHNRRQNIKIDNNEIKRKIIANALPIALSSSLLNLSSTLDLTIIIRRLVSSGMSDAYANSIYGNYTTLAVPMFNLVISVLTPIAVSYMPRLSEYDIAGRINEYKATFDRLLLVTLVISVPASLAFYFYSFDILDVLFSLQSSAVGAQMLITLSLGLCLLSTLTVVNTALESKRKISATVVSLLVGSVVKLFTSYALIGREGIGVLGAPIGTVFSYAISLAISLFYLERSGVRTHAVGKGLTLLAVGAIAFYPPYVFVYCYGLIESSFFSMLLSLAVSMIMYFVIIVLVYFILKGFGVFKMHKKL